MTTPNLRGDLTLDEGDRKFPYKDSRGIWSIGIGVNMEVRPELMARFAALAAHGLSQAEDDALLDQAIASAMADLDRDLPWWRSLDDVRQDAMVNLAFNLGEGKLRTWKHTLGDIQAGKFKAAGIDLLGDEPWASQVHDRARRLAYQLETGVRARAVSAAEIEHVLAGGVPRAIAPANLVPRWAMPPAAYLPPCELSPEDKLRLDAIVADHPRAPAAPDPVPDAPPKPPGSPETGAETEDAPAVPPLLKGVLHRFSHFGMGVSAALTGVGAYIVHNPVEATFLIATLALIIALAVGFAVWWSRQHQERIVEAINTPKPAVPVALPAHPFLKL